MCARFRGGAVKINRDRLAVLKIMSDDQSGSDKNGPDQTVGGHDLDGRLSRLDKALAGRQKETEAQANSQSSATGYAQAMRLSTEFVAAILVGAAIGWLLDQWLGIGPWGLIVFLLLGFVAGVLNVLRSANLVAGPDNRMNGDGAQDDKK